jgi:hypothetical protein
MLAGVTDRQDTANAVEVDDSALLLPARLGRPRPQVDPAWAGGWGCG